jgi:hypothetical protein
LRFTYANHPDTIPVGEALDELSQLRNHADYRLNTPGLFATATQATQAVLGAQAAIALLDAIEADPARRSTVIAAMRAAWP